MSEDRRGDVREELRSLGYLGGPVARFVAAGGRGKRLAAAAALGARVGLLAGAVVAASLWAGWLLLDRFLFVGPWDAAILALWLLALLAPLGAAFGAGAALVLRRLAPFLGFVRSGIEVRARRAGVLSGALAGLYLGALWVRLRLAFPGRGIATDLLAALAAAGAALVVGAATGSASLLGAARVRGVAGVRPRVSARTLPILLGLAAVAGAFVALLRLSQAGRDAGSTPGAFEVRVTDRSAILVAVDGVDAALLERLVQSGAMPALAALRERSARIAIDASAFGMPPVYWASVATGAAPDRHGVAAAAALRPRGFGGLLLLDRARVVLGRVLPAALEALSLARPVPATSALLSEKTVFEIVGERGLEVGVVQWWLTHPAQPLPGFVVSERAFWKGRYNAAARARGKRPLPVEGEIHPAEWFEEFERIGDFAEEGGAGGGRLEAAARRARALDDTALRAFFAFRARMRPRLGAVAFWGIDVLLHQVLAEGEGAASEFEAARRTEEAMGDLDRRVASILEAAPDVTLFLLTFPGSARRPGASTRYAGERALLWIAGPAVRAGLEREGSALDVAPTVLALLGFPASARMPGRVLAEAFAPGVLEARRIPAFPSPRRRPPPAAEFDDAMVRVLRELGYL